MSIKIGSNIGSLITQRALATASDQEAKSAERLSSGLRINRASDDAAGLAISSTLQSSSRVFTQAVRNVNDGQSYVNIAQGALQQLNTISVRQIELSEQAANGVYASKQRDAISKEIDALSAEFNRIVQSSSFNGKQVFDTTSDVRIQAGFGSENSLAISIGNSLAYVAGSGSFVTTAASNPGGDFLIDFDTDGDLDIFSTGGGLRFNDGKGNFSAAVYSATAPGNGVFTDLNKDGFQDYIVKNYYSSDISVFSGQANGSLVLTQLLVSPVGVATSEYGSLAMSDIDGDGDVDFIYTNDYTNDSAILRNDGGTLSSAGSIGVQAGYSNNWAAGDIDGDGDEDLVSGTGAVRLNNGKGTYALGLTIAGFNSIGGQLVDLNHDGKLDFVSTEGANGPNGTGNIFVALGNGNGTFGGITSYQVSATTYRASAITIKDVNNDGHLDAITNDGYASGNTFIAYGTGTGTFSSSISLSGNGAVGDINGDGVVDFLNQTQINIQSTTKKLQITSVDIFTQGQARDALTFFQKQQKRISTEIGSIGAFQSRLSTAVENLQSTKINYDAANSRIVDTDVAAESANITRTQIIKQTAVAILSQANLAPKLALALLRP